MPSKFTLMKNILTTICFTAFIVSCHKSGSAIPKVKQSGSMTKESSNGENLSLAPRARIFMKNCDQAIRSMSKLTGVSEQDPAVQKIISETKGSCPNSSDPESFDAPQILAYQKIALEFCGGYVNQVILKDKVAGINGRLTPNQALTASAVQALAQDYYARFWMGPREGIPSFDALKSSIEPLIEDLKRTATETDLATQAIIQGSCAAVLSAAPVITL